MVKIEAVTVKKGVHKGSCETYRLNSAAWQTEAAESMERAFEDVPQHARSRDKASFWRRGLRICKGPYESHILEVSDDGVRIASPMDHREARRSCLWGLT